MKENTFSVRILLAAALCLVAAPPGCGKKQTASTAAPPAETAGPQPASASPSAPPVAVAPVNAPDLSKASAAVDAALKAREYDQAAQTLLLLQRQKDLTDQQAQEVHGRMLRLQADLVGAIERGDPKARAAAEMLRRSSLR